MHNRLLILGHFEEGKTETEVVEMFQIKFPTLREWVVRFLNEGIEGLREKAGKERKRKLLPEREGEFLQQVETLQAEH